MPNRRAAFGLFSIAAAGFALLLSWETCGFGVCPELGGLTAYQPGGAPVLLDRKGVRIGDLAPADRKIVPLREFPRHLPEAFMAVEDQRFFDHGGIDWRRVGGAALANLRRGRFAEGSSTISMQLARTVFPDLLPIEERTLRRKLLEIRVANEIEDRFTKIQILELYLNHVYLGRGLHGVENAALEMFGISARKLSLAQSALLAAMVKAPAKYDPRTDPEQARARRNLVIDRMVEQGRVPEETAKAAARSPLGLATKPYERRSTAGMAPYFVEQIRHQVEKSGDELPATIYTTLDSNIQRAAEEELQVQLEAIESGAAGKFSGPRYDASALGAKTQTGYLQGAVVVLDARSGDVLAWVGGRDFTQSRFDRVSDARRQAGSAFKPFVYSAAIAGGYSLSKPLDDSPVKIKLDKKRSWAPRNVRGRHEGIVTMRDALVRSNNTATVRLAQQVGMDAIAASARNAGLRVDNDYPSLALGAIHVTPLELTSAYSMFANQGTRVEPRFILQTQDKTGNVLSKPGSEKRRVMNAATAYLVTDVLSDVIRRGTGKEARPKRASVAAAGKTGTTNDVTDTWFIGYTPDLVAGIWIGFDTPRPIVDEATAARLAAPVWGKLVDRIYDERKVPQPWNMPEGVRKYRVDVATGSPIGSGCASASKREELFAEGNLQLADCPEPSFSGPRVIVVERFPDGDERVAEADSHGREAVLERPVESSRRESLPAARNEPLPRRDSPPPPPGDQEERPAVLPPLILDVAAPDLSGTWTLDTQIRSTSVPEYRGMRLGYRVELEQRGNRLFGRGRKILENGRAIDGAARTEITLNGSVHGDEVTLAFREDGTKRASGGTFRFLVSPDSRGLGGSFNSDAADTSGSAVAARMR